MTEVQLVTHGQGTPLRGSWGAIGVAEWSVNPEEGRNSFSDGTQASLALLRFSE